MQRQLRHDALARLKSLSQEQQVGIARWRSENGLYERIYLVAFQPPDTLPCVAEVEDLVIREELRGKVDGIYLTLECMRCELKNHCVSPLAHETFCPCDDRRFCALRVNLCHERSINAPLDPKPV